MRRAAALLGGVLMVIATSSSSKAETETPAYRVVGEQNGYEIREYDPMILATVQMEGEYRPALFGGFRQLADYISGDNGTEHPIAMTAPVLHQQRDGEAGARVHVVSFVMPREYDLDALPAPNNPGIELEALPPRRYAALRFSWWATEDKIEEKRADLETLLAGDGFRPIGPVLLAQYDPPWRLPFLRRNEILVEIEDGDANGDRP